MKKHYLYLIMSFFFGTIFSQNHYCGSHAKMQNIDNSLSELSTIYKSKLNNNKSAVVTIPVVFHILHENGIDNISDAQVMDAMDILNMHYRGSNPDTSQVIEVFKPIIGDTKIEFKLAAMDPDGNCTNGIEHIYSHETNFADDSSKINLWPPNQYLNIWVVRTLKQSGVSGYAYTPEFIETNSLNCYDGVMILNSFLGSIGTSAISRKNTLTHFVGHYLGLKHLNGDAPAGVCGDDGLADTPITKGFSSCSSENKICDTNIIENHQNFMEFSYCQHMFTNDQSNLMYNSIHSSVAYRSNLIDSINQISTGISIISVPLCSPIPDFNSSMTQACLGSNVMFYDQSWNSPVTNRFWTFEDGNTPSSNLVNPVVSFTSPGFKKVTLTVSNGAGSNTIEKIAYIYVSPDWTDM